MPGKTSNRNSQTKRRSLRVYSTKVFQESSIGVISSVANTSSKSRKFFKVLVFLLCLTGFLYQSGKYLSFVFQYPTTVDIDVLRPDTYPLPGYTFCDNNWINRRLFCEKYPDRCEEPSEKFCNKYSYYCGENKTMVPKKQYFNYQIKNDFDELVDLNEEREKFILGNTGLDKGITGPLFRMKDYNSSEYNLCYSINDRVNNSLNPLSFTTNKIYRWPVNQFSFKVRSDEVFLPGNKPGILFALHSQFEAANPFETGAFMRPGRTYMVYLSMEEEVLEKRPYDTDCINYTELWEKNNRSGHRLQAMCRHDCISDLAVMCYNCNLPTFYFPRNEKFCDIKALPKINCKPSYIEIHLDACEKKCRDDCAYTKFRYTVQERFKGDFDANGDTIPNIDDIVHVEIYIEDEVKIYKHSPKYMMPRNVEIAISVNVGWKLQISPAFETVEAVSSIGGFIGIWLGMSLLDVAEIFEAFIRIIQYSFKKIK